MAEQLTEAASKASIRKWVESGQCFLAFDAARDAMEQFPKAAWPRQLAARALTRLGAPYEAEKVLSPLLGGAHGSDAAVRAAATRLRDGLRQWIGEGNDRATTAGGELPAESISAMMALLRDGRELMQLAAGPSATDEETLGLAARVRKDLWRQSGRIEDLRLARGYYRDAGLQTGGHWTLINAATLSVLLGRALMAAGDGEAGTREVEAGRTLARRVVDTFAPHTGIAIAAASERFWTHASLGEAHLLLGDEAAAVREYTAAMGLEKNRFAVVSVFEQLRLMQTGGIAVPDAIWHLRHLPVVLVFTGHMLDRPGQAKARFPASLEPAVRKAIDAELERLDPDVGYVSAACGSDLIFAEAMLERDAELHVVLPFDEDDFLATSVAWAGPAWVRRYRRVRKLAGDHVSFATRERYLGTDALFTFANRLTYGAALFKSHTAGARPKIVAVLDSSAAGGEGGAAAAAAGWGKDESPRVIDLRALREGDAPARNEPHPDAAASSEAVAEGSRVAINPLPGDEAPRVIKSMMFADVVGYSTLEEQHVSHFMFTFLRRVAERLSRVSPQPQMLNTWGDAIFAVGESAQSIAAYALALQEAVGATDWRAGGLPAGLNVRIGVHAGPVFETIDPITGRPNYFGSHVNRAARIEPITVPGHIYASEQFVALLIAETGSLQTESGYVVEYLGRQMLAKNFGEQAVYHVRAKRVAMKDS